MSRWGAEVRQSVKTTNNVTYEHFHIAASPSGRAWGVRA
jgi:hypothetical protein